MRNQPVWSSRSNTVTDSIIQCIWKGREDSTVSKYCLYLRKYLTFLREKNYSNVLPFSSDCVAEYLTILKIENQSKSTINATMASLKWIHSFIPGVNNWNNPMNDDFLSKIVSSSNRRPSGPKNQKKPIKGEMILHMLRISNLDCLVELRNCLIVLFAFCLLLRHDELSHVTLNHIEDTEEGYKILIPNP